MGVLFLHIVALIPSFLQHFTVLKQDPNVDLSYSLSIWIGIGLCACFAGLGYWSMTAPLLAVHGVVSGATRTNHQLWNETERRDLWCRLVAVSTPVPSVFQSIQLLVPVVSGTFALTCMLYPVQEPSKTDLVCMCAAIAGAAACVMQTLVYFGAQMKCSDLQTASLGCSTCPCALANSCNAVRSWTCTDCYCHSVDPKHRLVPAALRYTENGIMTDPKYWVHYSWVT